MEAALEKSAMRKIYLRLLPFAVLSYVLAYIDRINVSFAGLTMRGDLKLSATDFGFALGTFFLGYFIFEVPSNVIMEKVGARIWIARIMITWGIFAGAMAFVTDVTSFSIVTVCSCAEAGIASNCKAKNDRQQLRAINFMSRIRERNNDSRIAALPHLSFATR